MNFPLFLLKEQGLEGENDSVQLHSALLLEGSLVLERIQSVTDPTSHVNNKLMPKHSFTFFPLPETTGRVWSLESK